MRHHDGAALFGGGHVPGGQRSGRKCERVTMPAVPFSMARAVSALIERLPFKMLEMNCWERPECHESFFWEPATSIARLMKGFCSMSHSITP